MIPFLDLIGLTLSFGGVLLSAYGSYILNQPKDYTKARVIFTFSNPMQFFAFAGGLFGVWSIVMPAAAQAGLYLFYCASSVYGWLR